MKIVDNALFNNTPLVAIVGRTYRSVKNGNVYLAYMPQSGRTTLVNLATGIRFGDADPFGGKSEQFEEIEGTFTIEKIVK